jgi:hypothetical protein
MGIIPEDRKVPFRFSLIILFYTLKVRNHKPLAKFRILIKDSWAIIER